MFQDLVLFCALKPLSREAELTGDTETNLGEQSKVWKDIAVGSDNFFEEDAHCGSTVSLHVQLEWQDVYSCSFIIQSSGWLVGEVQ